MSFCERTSTGNIPLVDGIKLYDTGSNLPTGEHLERGIASSALCVRRNPAGLPSTGPDAKLGVLFMGMSNWKQETAEFIKLFRARYGLSRRITWIQGGRGGWDAVRMANNPIEYITWLDQYLAKRNITREQIQVIFFKNSIARQAYPADKLGDMVHLIYSYCEAWFPNLRQFYVTSAGYSGYCSSGVRLEPDAYLEGISVRRFLLDNIHFDHPDESWLGWGPYGWADGINQRQDGLRWLCADFATDGVHPGPSAKMKWATLILNFMENHPVAKVWFLRDL